MNPIVLVPGLICDARVFDAQVEALPGAIAMAGHGERKSLTEMASHMLALAPPRFALLGHSMGARVALEMWRMAPNRIERLCLMSAKVSPVAANEAAGRFALRDIGRVQGFSAMVDAWLMPMLAPAARTDAEVVARLVTMCREQGLLAYEAQIHALLHRPDAEAVLASVDCPTLVATGELDGWSPPEHQSLIKAILPGAQIEIVSGAGHMLPAEAPEAVNQIIKQWCALPARKRAA